MPDGLYDYFAHQDCLSRPEESDETLAQMHARLQREMRAEYAKKPAPYQSEPGLEAHEIEP